MSYKKIFTNIIPELFFISRPMNIFNEIMYNFLDDYPSRQFHTPPMRVLPIFVHSPSNHHHTSLIRTEIGGMLKDMINSLRYLEQSLYFNRYHHTPYTQPQDAEMLNQKFYSSQNKNYSKAQQHQHEKQDDKYHRSSQLSDHDKLKKQVAELPQNLQKILENEGIYKADKSKIKKLMIKYKEGADNALKPEEQKSLFQILVARKNIIEKEISH